MITRMYNQIMGRIYSMLARGAVKLIQNAGKTQRVQIRFAPDETISDIERFEQYGLATYPLAATAEALTAFLNGNRGQGIVIAIHDRELRPSYLIAGDVALYGPVDKTVAQRIWMRADGTISITAATINITATTLNIVGIVPIVGTLTVTGDVSDMNPTTPTMADMRALFNAHVHTSAAPGAPTSTPTTSM